RDHLATLARDDEAEPRPQPLAGELEERWLEILLAPGQLRDRRPVELEHPREERGRDLVPGVGGDLDAVFHERAPLPAHLVPPLAPQAPEIVVEGREARVRPVVLPAGTPQPGAGIERGGLLGQTEIDVDGREPAVAARLLESAAEDRDGVAARQAVRDEEAWTRDGREWHRDEELRIVREPGPH